MSIQELVPKNRILFLKEFTEELVINSIKDRNLRNFIQARRIKKSFVQPMNIEKKDGKIFLIPEKFEKSIIHYEGTIKEKKETSIRKVKLPKKIEYKQSKALNRDELKLSLKEQIKKPSQMLINQNKIMTDIRRLPLKKPAYPDMNFPIPTPVFTSSTPTTISPNLTKLDPFVKDNTVQMIECKGPGKGILIKAKNRISSTRVTLSEQEIKNIIDYFSNSAQIPIMGGILKAAVDNLIISAVVSDYVGSRFIITKQSPYSLIEGVNPGFYN